MRDPFRPNTNKQLVREAQFGFTVIGLLIAVLIFVAYYRLNNLRDITPQHIKDAPVAMQVFPNSPNYDKKSNLMLDDDSPKRVAFPKKKESTLASAPKRIMNDSQNTFRSLNDAAESIQESAAKVNSLASTPISKQPVGLVSNPAAARPRDSGFKITNQPRPDSATRKIPFPATNLKPSTVPPMLESKSIQSLLNQFDPTNKSMPEKSMPAKDEPSNDFKAINSDTKAFSKATELASKPSLFQARQNSEPTTNPAPEDKTAQSLQRLPQNPKRKLSDLRPPEEKKPAEPAQFESPSPALTAPAPKIKTVAFEQTTWTVKKGDSFYSIAQSQYGDGRFFRALFECNRLKFQFLRFEDLTEGMELVLPTADELCKMHPRLCPADAVRKNDPWRETPDDLLKELSDACDADLDRRLYETKPGDTLFGVARQQLGQASRYVELLNLNQYRIDTNMTHESELPPGTQLLLPIE